MTKTIMLFLILVPISYIISQTETSKKHSYVGVQVCAPCHKTEKQGLQLDIWQKSKHSQAYKTLQTEKANNIAKEKGCTTPAAETKACLKCHVSGYNIEAALLGEKFKMEDGVQCETCHGPGSDYKTLKIMKSREESVAAAVPTTARSVSGATGWEELSRATGRVGAHPRPEWLHGPPRRA